MAIKKFKPVTPSSRFRTVVENTELSKKEPEESLIEPLPNKGGRNSHGHITVRQIGRASCRERV